MANAPAAGHALDVLALIARRGEPVPAAAIARDLGLPRSSVYHLLGVLVDRGYVRHLPEERRYGLGLAAYELGSAYQRQAPLERMARGSWTGSSTRPATTPTSRSCTGATSSTSSSSGRPAGRCSSPTWGCGCPPRSRHPGWRCSRRCRRRRCAPSTPTGRRSCSATGAARRRRPGCARSCRPCASAATPSRTASSPAGLGSVAVAVLDHNDYPVAGVAVTYPQADVDAAGTARLVDAVARAASSLSARPVAADPGSE